MLHLLLAECSPQGGIDHVQGRSLTAHFDRLVDTSYLQRDVRGGGKVDEQLQAGLPVLAEAAALYFQRIGARRNLEELISAVCLNWSCEKTGCWGPKE